MKFILTIVLGLFCASLMSGQSSINSGAVSNNNFIYSVGEIFVIPTNQNEINSGIIGSVSIIEFNALSIEEVVANKNFKFYPNPTSGMLFLETNNINAENISIYDANGRLMVKMAIINNKVDLSTLQAGIYFVKLNNNNTQTFKIIKE